MYNVENLQEKWAPVLHHKDLSEIQNPYRRTVTTILLENEEQFLKEQALNEAPSNVTGGVQNWDPILVSLVRRAMPNLIAFDVVGVQPMTGPTGLLFALRTRFTSQTGTEALFNEADTAFSGTGTQAGTDPTAVGYSTGTGSPTATGEDLGAGTPFAEMAFSIEKTTVTAKTRALKAEYSSELAQDLKAIHGLDAESELANILSAEILAEINREVIRTIYIAAKPGAQTDVVTPGTFDLNTDSNGRWSVEKFKGLLFQIERDANQVAKETRRGKGNIVICSSDVASALSMAGILDHNPSLQTNLNVDDTGNTFAGILNGRIRVFVDPYASSNYIVVGYKGGSPYDAGIFYAPYVPLQMVKAIGENTFQPKIGFKTRYGIVANPFASLAADSNQYYRLTNVLNLM